MPDPYVILLANSLRFTPEQIRAMTPMQAWQAVYEEQQPKRRPVQATICFTGFTAPEKLRLAGEAIRRGLRPVTGMRASLGFLCAGPNAGPRKLKQAKEQQTQLISEPELLAMPALKTDLSMNNNTNL